MVVSVYANVWQHIQPSVKTNNTRFCLLGINQRLCGWRVICNYIHVHRHGRHTDKHHVKGRGGMKVNLRESQTNPGIRCCGRGFNQERKRLGCVSEVAVRVHELVMTVCWR